MIKAKKQSGEVDVIMSNYAKTCRQTKENLEEKDGRLGRVLAQ